MKMLIILLDEYTYSPIQMKGLIENSKQSKQLVGADILRHKVHKPVYTQYVVIWFCTV